MSGAAGAGAPRTHETLEANSSAPPSRKSSSGSTGSSGSGGGGDEGDEADVAALLAEVKGAMHAAPTADEQRVEEEEADDKVNLADHIDMNQLTLADKDDAASNANSAANSVAASPAIEARGGHTPSVGATNSASALSALPPVELKDGGNAAMQPSGGDASADSASTSASSVSSSSSSSGEAAAPGAKRNFFDVRVAVVGNVDSGKSTLIGVLTGGALDNGRGLARSKVFIHAHELGTGRTSAISQHIVGFDAAGAPVHQTVAASAQSAAKTKSWATVVAASAHLMTFIDLAGHESYLKTTIAGLTGSHPDYALIIINSLAGVTRMTREHLGVVLALELPLIVVVSKVDLAPMPVLEATKKQLFKILKSSAANKMPIQMRNEGDVATVIENSRSSNKLCPVFFISAVNGTHIPLLTSYLSKLRPHHEWLARYAANMDPAAGGGVGAGAGAGGSAAGLCAEFCIDEVFNVSGIGIVVSGTLSSGTLTPGQTLLLGPQSDNSFAPVLVRSLHYKRVNVSSVEAGQSCAVAIRALKKKETLKRNLIRRGQVLVDPAVNPRPTRFFDAEVLILHHPTTIKLGYQAVLHCGMIRQTAQICRIQKQHLRTGDKSICRFRFMMRVSGATMHRDATLRLASQTTTDVGMQSRLPDEYLHTGAAFVFREGSTKGIGKVVRIAFTDEERVQMEEEEKARKKAMLGGGPKKTAEAEDDAAVDATPTSASAAAPAPSATAAPAAAPAPHPTAAPAASSSAGHDGKKATAAASSSHAHAGKDDVAHGHGHGHGHGHAKHDKHHK